MQKQARRIVNSKLKNTKTGNALESTSSAWDATDIDRAQVSSLLETSMQHSLMGIPCLKLEVSKLEIDG